MFDLSIAEIFTTLISGGCLCMLPDSERLTGELAKSVRELSVNFLHLTPTMASLLEPEDFTSLRTLCLGGEPATRKVLERWTSGKDAPWVLNAYGPAEAGFISCVNVSVVPRHPNNIGRPVGCQFFIADLYNPDRLAAIGAVGELIISGGNIADGYLKNSDITAQVFGLGLKWLADKHEDILRYYRTGDIVKYNHDGSLHYIGRRDLQRKIYGQRLELGEIESQIMACSGFHGAVVELVGSSTLVAFLKTEKTRGVFAEFFPPDKFEPGVLDDLNTYLKSKLPSYMIPSVYVPTPQFPTTSSGKTDRRLLRSSVEHLLHDYRYGRLISKDKPLTENQNILKQLWAKAIPIAPEHIGVNDGFFSLGGTSIGVIRLLQLIRKSHLKLDVSVVYQCNTLAEMASVLCVGEPSADLDTVPPPFSLIKSLNKEQCTLLASTKCNVPRSSVLNVYPCSYMQEAMMIFSAKNPGSYFFQNVYRIGRAADIPKAVKALNTVWQRHDILRTRIFLDEEFRSIQAVTDEPLYIPTINDDLNTYMERIKPPKYGEALSKCAVLTTQHGTYLVLSQHHAVFDAWSSELLLQDLKREYSGSPSGSSETGRFSRFIQSTLKVQNHPSAAQYWRESLSDIRITQFPQVKKGPFRVNKEYKSTINLSSKPMASPAVLVEAAWGILLGRYTDSDDICFGVVRSGRTASVPGVDTIMGPTLVSIPQRLRPAKTLSLIEFIRQVERLTGKALLWEQYGLQKIRELSESSRLACDFKSMVIVQHQSETTSKSELDLRPLEQHGAWSDDCLTLECQPQQDGTMFVSISYDDRAISVEEVHWISYNFSQLILELNTGQDRNIEELNMAGPESIRNTLLWNQHRIPITARRVEEIFCERVRNWPTVTAVDAVDGILTYQELDDLSSVLAYDLKSSGLTRGELVPLCLEKSGIMIVAILAVLKAGGTYVPMEIDHPLDRLKYIVRDVGARRVLCTPRQEILCHQFECSSTTIEIDALKDSCLERKRYVHQFKSPEPFHTKI